jgi:gliding motility-associated-like protein
MTQFHKFQGLLFAFLLFNFAVSAQTPANDNCANAQFIYLDETGNTCISSSNLFASGDGYSNACDAAAQIPLPPGGHEVWFTYIATGPVNTITVSPIGGSGIQKASITVSNGNCAVGGTNVCNTATNPGDPTSAAFSTGTGTQIWFSVTSLIADGDFLLCVNSTTGFISPGTTCNSAVNICNKVDFSSPGSIVNSSSVSPSCFTTPTKRELWYKFTVGTSGPLEFSGFPNNIGGFRWALYDITGGGCPGTEVSCNNVYDPLQPFGLSSSVANCSSSPYCPPVNVVAGNTYALMVDDTSQSGSGFDFSWGPSVKLLPTADFSVDSTLACGSLTLNFTNLSTYNNSTSYVLDYGDATPAYTGTGASFTLPQHTYGPGSYIVKLTLTQAGSCSHTFSRQIIVNPKPAATFTMSTDSACYDGSNPVSVDFTSSLSSFTAAYNWGYPGNTGILGTGIGQNTVFWSSAGVIPITLSVTENGCASDTTRDTLRIFSNPSATFAIADSGCTATPVNVQYTGGAVSSATYAWTYGGGTVTNSTNQSFDVAWNTPGKYGITLAVLENGCLSFPYTDSIQIFQTPSITVTPPSNVCQDDTLTVVSIATSATTGLTYTWDFGTSTLISGTPASGGSADFTWPTAGQTYWKATAVSIEGCSSNTDSVPMTVRPKPTSTFTIADDQLCGNDSTTLTFTGSILSAGPTYTWNFGGGIANGAAAGPKTVHYTAAGTYPIYLVTADNYCVSDTTRDTITVANYPIADAGVDSTICSNISLTIGTIPTVGYTYSWSPSNFLFGSTIANPQVVIPNFGTTDTLVRYIVATTEGFCTSKDTVLVTVKPYQLAYFTPPPSQCFEGNAFDFKPQYAVVPGATYTWSFGANGTPDSAFIAQPQNITFSAPGWQTISFYTTTGNCPSDAYTDSVYVKANPVVTIDATPQAGCPPLDVTFSNLSPALAGSSILWDFGNGDTSTTNDPLYTYQVAGNFNPSLTITSADTCSTTANLSGTIDVSPIPDATFLATPRTVTTLNPIITFEAVFPATTCYFDFGDGTGDSSCFSQHAYQDTGMFVVNFYAINAGGCIDSAQITVEVQDMYVLNIPSAFTPNNDLINDKFQYSAQGVRSFEMQVFNRRGQIVWETTKTDDSWNGDYLDSNAECPSGVYVYRVRTKDVNNKKHEVTGRITIVR